MLTQPDATTCGSCVAVRARMLLDEGYDAWLRTDPGGARFRREALATHVRTNRWPPWPLALGTQPWALAAELTRVSRTRYVVRPALPWHRDAAYAQALAAVPVYVGNAALPRHVVLVLAAGAEALAVYDPARGADVRVTRDAWVAGRLSLSGWDLPWAVVRPADLRLSRPARRTPA